MPVVKAGCNQPAANKAEDREETNFWDSHKEKQAGHREEKTRKPRRGNLVDPYTLMIMLNVLNFHLVL